jgi:hypothetical protein
METLYQMALGVWHSLCGHFAFCAWQDATRLFYCIQELAAHEVSWAVSCYFGPVQDR